MQVIKEKVATIESTQFDRIVKRYPSALKTYALLKSYFTNREKILDYGSGNGIFLRILQKNNHNAWGWEPSNQLVEAVNVFQNIKNNFSAIEKITNQKYDVIVSLRTWAYIPNKAEVIRLWSELLSEDGILILENGNYDYYLGKYISKIPMYQGWDIKEQERCFGRHFKLEKKIIGFSPYYHGSISDSFLRIAVKKAMNCIDRSLGKYFSFFAPHYIYI